MIDPDAVGESASGVDGDARDWGRRGMARNRKIRVTFAAMRYAFLVETYATERVKLVSVWSEFRDEDLPVRPRDGDPRGRSVQEQMVHQCVSEDLWFRNMLGMDVGAPPLPKQETRMEFMKRYAEDSGSRLALLQDKGEAWWEEDAKFFDVLRSRAWVMTRRMTHTSHHRGQLMAMLRMLGREVHSNTDQPQIQAADAESCTYDLCVSELGGTLRGGKHRGREGDAAGAEGKA